MSWFRRSAHLEEELSAYVDGELSERASRAVETHLASCEACSGLLAELQDTKSLLSELPKVEPRRSLVLGPEFAIERKAATPRRASFTSAPAAVALTFLVALVFADVTDSTGGSSDDSAFSTAETTAASRAAPQPESGAGLASEPPKAADDESAALGTVYSAAAQDGVDASSGEAGGAVAQPSRDEALQPRAIEVPPAPAQVADDGAEADASAAGPEETSQPAGADDSSGGTSTLRILQIVSALALAASLLAVFVPRIMGRKER